MAVGAGADTASIGVLVRPRPTGLVSERLRESIVRLGRRARLVTPDESVPTDVDALLVYGNAAWFRHQLDELAAAPPTPVRASSSGTASRCRRRLHRACPALGFTRASWRRLPFATAARPILIRTSACSATSTSAESSTASSSPPRALSKRWPRSESSRPPCRSVATRSTVAISASTGISTCCSSARSMCRAAAVPSGSFESEAWR